MSVPLGALGINADGSSSSESLPETKQQDNNGDKTTPPPSLAPPPSLTTPRTSEPVGILDFLSNEDVEKLDANLLKSPRKNSKSSTKSTKSSTKTSKHKKRKKKRSSVSSKDLSSSSGESGRRGRKSSKVPLPNFGSLGKSKTKPELVGADSPRGAHKQLDGLVSRSESSPNLGTSRRGSFSRTMSSMDGSSSVAASSSLAQSTDASSTDDDQSGESCDGKDLSFETRDGVRHIISATLERLVDELEDAVSNSEFCLVFTSMYTYFSDVEELWDVLMERLINDKTVEAINKASDPGEKTRIKMHRKILIVRISNVLKLWINQNAILLHQSPEQQALIKQCVAKLRAADSGLERAATSLESTLQQKLSHYEQRLKAPKKLQVELPTIWVRADDDQQVDTDVVLSHSPLELAQALTYIETEYFYAIDPNELLHKRFAKQERSPNLHATIERFNAVTAWVSTCIVMASTSASRVELIAKFIEVAKAFESLNNFSGLIQIVSALQNVSISRLKQTWKLVPARALTTFDQLCPYANPEGNYAVYRRKLSEANVPFLPFAGCFTKDLTAIGEMPDKVANDTKINWEKMTHLGRIIITIRKAQDFPYKYDSLNIGLANKLVRFQLMSEKGIYRVSKTIEPSASDPVNSPKITRKTIKREAKMHARAEKEKRKHQRAAKEKQEKQRAKAQKKAATEAILCSRCIDHRAAIEVTRLTTQTFQKDAKEVRQTITNFDEQIGALSEFYDKIAPTNSNAPNLLQQTKTELLKQFNSQQQLENGLKFNENRLKEAEQSLKEAKQSAQNMLALSRYAHARAQKMQSHLAVLKQLDTDASQPMVLLAVDSMVQSIHSLMDHLENQTLPSQQ
mmetsp:Transcript_15385/g.23041  ORF Transcript_15385/g.23041 Transcript_15385/m.23041 type:complete len:856 (+) Transcript_15385:26-2593(+)